MSQQFRIESEALRDKLNSLLPSQNRGAIGVELTGSTQIVPIIDLTETAEGGDARADLQTAFSLTSITNNSVDNATTTLVNTTGYYRVFGVCSFNSNFDITLRLTDGTTTKNITKYFGFTSKSYQSFDFIVFLPAGVSLVCVSSGANATCNVTTRQIADITGSLVNPI